MLDYDYKKSVGISSDDHKLAALFFEEIIPFRPYFCDMQQDWDSTPATLTPSWVNESVYQEMIGFSEKNADIRLNINYQKKYAIKKWLKSGVRITATLGEDFVKECQNSCMSSCPDHIEHKRAMANAETYYAAVYLNTVKKISAVPILKDSENIKITTSESSNSCIELLLTHLKLVDTSKADWSQIIEIRKDEGSAKQLRNLRLFFYDNYRDKSITQIKDSIDQKLDLYEAALSKHGFDTLQSSISTVLDSKSILGSIGLSMAAFLTGEAKWGTAALLSGAILETSKIAVNLIKSKHEVNSLKTNHELAFLLKSNEKLK